jgi:hypothetical protein
MQRIYAYTLWQPWASLVIGGWKPYEFRPRRAPAYVENTRIVIHAGKRPIVPCEVAQLMHELSAGVNCGGLSVECLPFLERVLREPEKIPRSAGLGSVLLGKSVLSSELWPGEFANDSDRLDKANWALPVSDPQPFAPIVPARGHQGWWRWVGETRL